MSNPGSSATSLMNGQAPSSRAASSHPQSVDEVIADINTAIDKLTDKFNTASQEFFGRLDEISTRLDALENSILAAHTTSEAGEDGSEKTTLKENGSDITTAEAKE
ncbi:hypothetical protein ABW20_dc0104154 [Dactylellina cionopaga]|nr:hypothetical protein ABW20_dc0104154 [Dactylellina cionopaga]